MKLLYATSISFPSQYANRLQIIANSEQFGKALGSSFWLGANSLKSREFPFQKIELGGPWKSPVLALKYLKILKKNAITHVYTREDRLFFFLKTYARIARLPVKFYFEAHTAKSGFFLNHAVRNADGIIAVTQGIKDDLASRGVPVGKVLVAHDAVDMSLFDIADSKQKLRSDFNIPVNAKVVAYVGKYTTMGKQKGVDELIEAFASAYKTNQILHLLIVGLSDAEMPLLKAVCNEEGLPQSAFTLVAHVPNAEVARYMKTADMLVMNYPNTEHYAKYMSPMKLFEYMAARVPIITTDLPSVREVLNDAEAFYVPAGDMGALKAKILEIAGHEKNASSKAEAAYKKVCADYTWDKRAQHILGFIQGKEASASIPVQKEHMSPKTTKRTKKTSSYLKEWMLMKLMYGMALFRGRAVKVPRKIDRILVVQMGKLGDMVCTTPVFRAIKNAFSHARLSVIGNTINKQVLADNKDVDTYIPLGKFKEMRARLKAEQYDCAVIAGGPDPVILSLLFLSGIRCIVAPVIVNGYSPWYTFTYRLMARLVITKPHRMGSYAPGEYLKLLEPLGIRSGDTTKHIGYSKDAGEKAARFIDEIKKSGRSVLVAMSPSAGNKIKEWPVDRFVAVADYLIENKNASVVIFGSPADKDIVDSMIKNMKNKQHVYSTQGKLSVDDLKATMKHMNLYIAADTGPMYVAEAFDVPTVDITGPIDEREQPPIGRKHVVVVPPSRKRPELYVMNARVYDYAEARRQAESITVDMVVAAADKALIG